MNDDLTARAWEVAVIMELHAAIGSTTKAKAAEIEKGLRPLIEAQDARIAALEAALDEIAHMGHDAPATYEGDEHIWQRHRAAMMQRIARAALVKP